MISERRTICYQKWIPNGASIPSDSKSVEDDYHRIETHSLESVSEVEEERMHLTVRMAWHDSDWNGHICQKPEENTYCIGTHSLLSGRIEKKRDLEFELENHGKPACESSTGEVPPCYWSINAFGQNQINVVHTHAFSWLNIDGIPDVLDPNSVYTWPFKLSFVHETKAKKKVGNYPPDLEDRIYRFTSKFTPGESINPLCFNRWNCFTPIALF